MDVRVKLLLRPTPPTPPLAIERKTSSSVVHVMPYDSNPQDAIVVSSSFFEQKGQSSNVSA